MRQVIVVLLAAFVLSAFAQTEENTRLLEIFPNDGKTASYKIWTTKDKVETEFMTRTDITFADITGINPVEAPKTLVFPDKPSKQSIVNEINKKIEKDSLSNYLNKLTSFPHRHSRRAGSEKSIEWLAQYTASLIKDLPEQRKKLFSFHVVPIRGYTAPSFYIEMKGSATPDVSVIIGAHADDVGHPQAGADDNASGSVTILEAFKVISQSSFVPKKTLIFMFYTAEEQGLIGSRQIAQQFKANQRKVYAVLQHDMVGYNRPGSNLESYIVDVQTNSALTVFLRKLIQEYSGIPFKNYGRGYGSDHISWNSAGYASACWKEFYFSPQYHSARDKPEFINFDLVKEFTKVAVAFGIELSSN
jgi:bacterial leucyl aminopeptidase